MPANSIDPLRVLPTKDTESLAHELNRILDRVTQHLNSRYGFSGPVTFHSSVDFRGNPVTNVGAGTSPNNAATVEQLRQLQAQLAAQDAVIAGILVQAGTQVMTFTRLADAPPGGYVGAALKGLRVVADESRLEYVDLVTSILQLVDVPDSFTGQALKTLRVLADETGMEWATLPQTLLALLDTPDTYVGQATNIVRVKPDETGIEFVPETGGVETFLALLDAPDSYAGQAGKVVTVNAGETALEFTTSTAGGGGGGGVPASRRRIFMHMGS